MKGEEDGPSLSSQLSVKQPNNDVSLTYRLNHLAKSVPTRQKAEQIKYAATALRAEKLMMQELTTMYGAQRSMNQVMRDVSQFNKNELDR